MPGLSDQPIDLLHHSFKILVWEAFSAPESWQKVSKAELMLNAFRGGQKHWVSLISLVFHFLCKAKYKLRKLDTHINLDQSLKLGVAKNVYQGTKVVGKVPILRWCFANVFGFQFSIYARNLISAHPWWWPAGWAMTNRSTIFWRVLFKTSRTE